jgi:dihydrofolate reductase
MKTSVFCAASMDGFIAKADDDIDWLKPYENDPHGFEEFFASIDGVVIGRRTFDVVLKFAQWFYSAPVFVLSSTLKTLPKLPKRAVCELINAEPRDVFKQLERRGFKHLYIDGGITIQRFLRAGFIDRMTITRVPILLGNGVPLFGSLPREIQLKHMETRSFPSGLVQSEYEVVR